MIAMAKLNAGSRTELARVERTSRLGADLVEWTRHTRVLMSDGTVLNKMDTKWKNDRKVQYGRWRWSGRLKVGVDASAWKARQAQNGYLPGARRHGWASITVATMTDAEVRDATKRLLR